MEVIRRQVGLLTVGRTVSRVTTTADSNLFLTNPLVLKRRLPGRRVEALKRVGKYLVVLFDDASRLLLHLGMTGQLFCTQPDFPLDKHTHFLLGFKGYPLELRFRDVRKFGFISCLFVDQAFGLNRLSRLGAEPLEIKFVDFVSLFNGRKARLKSLLLDQSFIAGIGNIYADEILFQAKLHPLLPAHLAGTEELRRLWGAIRKVLHQAIEHKGSSIRDYKDSMSQKGRFQDHHRVYGKESCFCSVCGQTIVRIRINGRSSFFCSGCQPFMMQSRE